MFLQSAPTPPRSRRASRGFTLIELIVVVLIIGIAAALSTPAMTSQIRERRSRDAAQRVALLYSQARMRALGRGSAVTVRYRPATGFTVLESVAGAAAPMGGPTCANQPGLGCLTSTWAVGDTARIVASLMPAADLTLAVNDNGGLPKTNMDICFSPMGRSFISFDESPTTIPMVGATTVDIQRTRAGAGVGLLRTVAILPNGMARLGL